MFFKVSQRDIAKIAFRVTVAKLLLIKADAGIHFSSQLDFNHSVFSSLVEHYPDYMTAKEFEIEVEKYKEDPKSNAKAALNECLTLLTEAKNLLVGETSESFKALWLEIVRLCDCVQYIVQKL